MAIRLQANQIQNLQQIEAGVSGPEGANRLFMVTGVTNNIGFSVFVSGGFNSQTQTFTLLVGPSLTRQQFFRAICTASLGQISQHAQVVPGDSTWAIISSDADWDDETGQVELRVEVSVTANGNNNSVTLNSFAFQVTILAAVDQ